MNDINKQPGQTTELKRTLILPLLIMFGLAYLAPTVVFNYYGIFETATGGMYTLSLIITACIMCFTAYSYTQMVKVYPSAGSAYTYVHKSVQPHVGFMTGWVMLVDYLLLLMICCLLIGVYVNSFFPAIPVWLIVIVVALLGMVINIIGMKTASIVDTIIISFQIAFTLLFLIVIAKYVSGGGGAGTFADGTALYNPETFSMSGVLGASAILCASFVGFDAVTTMAEEAKNPKKIMGKAIMGVIIGAGVMFAITAYFAHIAWPDAYARIQDPALGTYRFYGMRIHVPYHAIITGTHVKIFKTDLYMGAALQDHQYFDHAFVAVKVIVMDVLGFV